MTKRNASILFSLLVGVVVWITGCDSPQEPATTPTVSMVAPTVAATPTRTIAPPTPTATSAIQVGESELNQVQIAFWHPWTGELEETLAELVSEFNRQNDYGIRVNHESHRGQLTGDLRTAASLGEAPDLAAAYPHEINGWRAFGDISVDIQTYSSDPIWGLGAAQDDLVAPPGPGLPLIGSAYTIFYNRTWAEELGFDEPPTTPGEFEEQACAASGQRGDGLGGWIVSTHPTGILSWISAFGGQVTSAQGEYRFETTQVESALAYLQGLLDAGCAWVSPELYPNQAFAERQALFYESSVAGIPFQAEAFEQAGSQDEWIPIPYPAETGDPVMVTYNDQLAVLRTTAESQLAAWVFARWLAEPEQQSRLALAGNRLPVRVQAVESLPDEEAPSQWYEALQWLPNSHPEPVQASWGEVRWALRDAGEQLFAPQTTAEDIPAILNELQMIAEEIQALTP